MSRSSPADGPRRPTGADRRRADAEKLGATGASADVLGRYLEGGRLVALPTRRAQLLTLLDFFATQFDPGKVFPERDVNAVLRRYSDDTASIRRALVDEEFMQRRDGFYWRSGGTFDVD